jgi:hypothetical protein
VGKATMRRATRPPAAPAGLDTLLLTPLVSTLTTDRFVLLSSVAATSQRMTIDVPGPAPAVARSYDTRGHLTGVAGGRGPFVVNVPPGGFTVAA